MKTTFRAGTHRPVFLAKLNKAMPLFMNPADGGLDRLVTPRGEGGPLVEYQVWDSSARYFVGAKLHLRVPASVHGLYAAAFDKEISRGDGPYEASSEDLWPAIHLASRMMVLRGRLNVEGIDYPAGRDGLEAVICAVRFLDETLFPAL